MSQLPDRPPPDVTLRLVRIVSPLAAVVVAAAVVAGLATAPDGAAAELVGNVWGRVTIFDLYSALFASWVWITWRDRTLGAAVTWGLLLVVTGSIALWAYVAWRAGTARDMQELLLGPNDIGS